MSLTHRSGAGSDGSNEGTSQLTIAAKYLPQAFIPSTRQMCWTLFHASSFYSKIPWVFLNRANWNRKILREIPFWTARNLLKLTVAEFSWKTGFRCQLREVASDRSVQRTLVYRSLAVLPGAPCLLLPFCRERLLIAARLEQYRYYREADSLARFGTHNTSLFLPRQASA